MKGFYFSKHIDQGQGGEKYRSDVDGFWRAWEAGEIVPKTSADYLEWQRLQRDLEVARKADPFTRFGFVPARASLSTLVTSLFLHGDWLHILFNMLFLYLVGCSIEYRWGIPVYLVFYVLGGIVAGIAQAMSDWSSTVPCIGASGAIAAVMGAFMVRHAWAKVRVAYLFWSGFSFTRYGTFHIPAWMAASFWFLGQLWLAPMAKWLGSSVLPIGVFAHVGGFAFGIAVALAIRFSPLEKWVEARRARSPDYVPPPERTELESGLKFLAAGHPLQALGFLRKAVSRNPADAFAREKLIEALIEAGSPDEARSEMEAFLAEAKRKGNREAALSKASVFLDRYPEESFEPGLQQVLGRWFEETGDYARASRAYRNLASGHPDHPLAPKALFRAGEIQADRMGREDAGNECFRQLLAKHPASPLAPFARKRLGKDRAE